MSLPFTSTTISVERAENDGDRWEKRRYTRIKSGIPAIISDTASSDSDAAGSHQERVDAVLHVNPGEPVERGYRVHDDTTSACYDVMWVHERYGFGLGRIRAGLRQIEGVTP